MNKLSSSLSRERAEAAELSEVADMMGTASPRNRALSPRSRAGSRPDSPGRAFRSPCRPPSRPTSARYTHHIPLSPPLPHPCPLSLYPGPLLTCSCQPRYLLWVMFKVFFYVPAGVHHTFLIYIYNPKIYIYIHIYLFVHLFVHLFVLFTLMASADPAGIVPSVLPVSPSLCAGQS